MESTTDYSAPVDLQTFLQRHGSRLPSTVKLVEGFCGTNAENTLEGDQILIIYKVEKQNTIIALDQLNQELCVPRNTKNKVQLLPFDHHEEHKRIGHLFNPHQTEYFRVLEDLASLQISSETTLQLLSNQPLPNFAKCKVVDLYDSREIFLPLELEGRFQPLLDAREYYLEEVLAQYQLPVNIRFVLPSRANDGACFSHPLSSLKNIHLEHQAEVEMIFAASVDDPLSLNLFPRTLGINVRFGFKVTADTSRKIKQCRQTLAASERALKRLDKIASNSFYFKVCPVRRFNFESLQPPSISVPQTTKERAAILSKAKQNKSAEQTAINRDPRHVECPQSASISGLSFEENAADYENCETDESFTNSLITEARKAEEGADAVPVLPPKLSTRISRSTQSKDNTRANDQSRPVPKPRKRRNSAKNGNQENDNNAVSQPHSQDTNFPEWAGTSSGDDGEDTCPELPPRPAFLKIRSIEDNEDDDAPRERPPALPPRCPGPNQFGFPAYLVVDVTDWRAVDEKALGPNTIVDEELYSDAKDDGQVFKQNSVRHLDLSLMYPPDEGKAYIDRERPGAKGRPYVDMESHEKMEMDGRQSGRENFHKKDFIQPDETGISEELENSVLPNASTENGDEAARHHEEESSDEDCSYEEIEERDEPSQRENRSKGTENQEKTEVERPSKNPWRKATHGSCDTRPSRATIVNGQMNLRGVKISGHRDDDWMDFREIEHFLKLRKQLHEALSKKADLEKQVTLTRQNLASQSQTQQPPTSHQTGNATPHVDKADSLDENHNRFDSSRNSQRGTQAATKCESVSLKKGDDHETEMSKKPNLSSPEADESENKQPSLSSLAPVFSGNVSSNQKLSLTSVKERDDSEDDDDYDYEECYDREYINQQTGVNYSFENVSSEKEFRDHHVNAERQPAGNDLEDAADVIYYNTEELETHRDRSSTSPYLQLDNPNDEEEFVNTQKSDKGLATIKAEGNQPASFRAITAEVETFIAKKFACEGPPNALDCIKEPPPLPPKKGASSLRDAE